MHYAWQLILTGVFGSAASLCLALGFQIVFYVTRIFHFVYAGVYTIIAYIAYEFANRMQSGLLVAIIMALVGGLVITGIIEVGIYKPLRSRGAGTFGILIASLGSLVAIQSLEAIIWGNEPLMIKNLTAVTNGSVSMINVRIPTIQVAEVAIDVVLLAVLMWAMFRTTLGTKMRAVADAPGRAAAFGIDVDRMILYALLISSAVLVPISILEGMYSAVTPYGTEDLLLIATVAVFAGGIGSLGGTFVVTLVAGALTSLSVYVISSQWTTILLYGFLTLIILVRPRGLFGHRLREG